MAFDFGLRQIGVAIGNCLLQTTQPLPIIRAKEGIPDWQVVQGLVDEWCPDVLVVGDPLNMANFMTYCFWVYLIYSVKIFYFRMEIHSKSIENKFHIFNFKKY